MATSIRQSTASAGMEKVDGTALTTSTRRFVVWWLGSVCLLIVTMVVIGGITRLTQSGLSIVEWKVVTGVMPPWGHEAWVAEFAKYQQFPQYHLQFDGQMTLEQYQGLYFWEWFHRLLGRVIGLAYALPFLWLWWRGRLNATLRRQLGLGLLLGALQGAMGWFMVKSGLVSMPRVSHYRLAAHLLLALGTLGYLLWVAQEVAGPRGNEPAAEPSRSSASHALRRASLVFFGLVILQTTWGAFVAGLRAGYGYPTWPTMNGAFVPPGFWSATPAWASVLESPPAVQFVHRTLGLIVLTAATALVVFGLKQSPARRIRAALALVGGLCWLQVLLGIGTVLWSVPVSIATLHQAVGCLLFASTVVLLHRLWRERWAEAAPATPHLS